MNLGSKIPTFLDVRLLVLSQHFPPISGTLFFFRAEMFWPIEDLLPLVCWSQGSGYSLGVSKGSLYGVNPNQIGPKCWRWSNLMCSWVFHILKKRGAKINYNTEYIVVYCIVLYISFKWLAFINLSIVFLVEVYLYWRKELLKPNYNTKCVVLYCIWNI